MSIRTGMIAALAAIVLTVASATSAEAARRGRYGSWHRGPYLTGFVGGAFGGHTEFDDTFDVDQRAGFLVGATFGYDDLFPGPAGDFRFEAEVSHRSQDLKGPPGDEISVTTLMGNVWYDFYVRGPLVPYLGAGMGVGFLDEAGDETGFVFQLGGGLTYHMNPRWFLGVNYRYLVADFDVSGPFNDSEVDYSGNQLSFAVGYKF